jgi:RNase H-fold protein (predicted Holliday junction resolvase)
MALKPWYKVDGIELRQDIREKKAFDSSEFAVHLDHVRNQQAPADYRIPERFFERTYLTRNLTEFAAQVCRRLSGQTAETSAVFNLSTQFGGGKTHALTLLYHLAKNGADANGWFGVEKILDRAQLSTIPEANVAVFVGTEFDSLRGRGGGDGTPHRQTPWGEMAYQLGGDKAFAVVAEHDERFIEPKGDVIRAMLPKDRPNLILIDEVLHYVSTYRSLEYNDRLYNFLQSLSETVRGETNTVLVVSIPASEMEYTEKDEADEQRFKKMLDRLGLAIMMSAESETSEIIRRRLFDWDPKYISAGDKIMLSRDAIATCNEYADWMVEHRQQLPNWFDIDNAREVFKATYPFHPTLLSVFERKWQALPRFQRTRGVLRMLAMWLSDAYEKGFTGAHKDPLITLGTAPLDNMDFRSVVLEQMGDGRLEGAVTSDIDGKQDAHAPRLDKEAVADIKKARLHRKVATAIFFESNGGCTRAEATIPEIRLDVADPSIDIGHIETVLETIKDEFYYLSIEKNRYHFTLYPNLNKILADRRASVQKPRIDEYVRSYIQKVFVPAHGIAPKFFPEESAAIPNRPELAIAVMAPEHSIQELDTLTLVEQLIRESGSSDRTFKSAIIVAIADSNAQMREEARKLLAWEDIRDEEPEGLTEHQQRQITENIAKAQRDLKEAVWRSYKYIAILGKDNTVQTKDMGLITSSSGSSMTSYIIQDRRKTDEIQDSISPRFLVRNWSPAFTEWSTKSVRDACFASPQFPRLLDPNSIKDTIVRGVSSGEIAYVGKKEDKYDPFKFQVSLSPSEIEISDDVFIIKRSDAQAYEERSKEPPVLTTLRLMPQTVALEPGIKQAYTVHGFDQWGTHLDPGPITWSTTGGDIATDGVLTAGQASGNFTVTAKAGDISATVNFTVRAKSASDGQAEPFGSNSGSDSDTGSTPPPDPVPQTTSLKWKGEVPTQKWTNFYMRVLSKFASDKSLNLKLIVEVEADGEVSEQKRQEAEAALRELGLEGNFLE